MNNNTIARFALSIDTQSNWEKVHENITPKKGEPFYYTDDSKKVIGKKIGDGTKTLAALPFIHLLGVDELTRGAGENSIQFADGIAEGNASVAGGMADKKLFEELLGPTLANYVDAQPAKTEGALSVAMGVNNISKSAGSLTLGVSNTTGINGYYWHTINFTNKTITLTEERPTTLSSAIDAPSNIDWAVGDYICIVNGDFYPLCAKITNINGTTITVDTLPFSESDYDTSLFGQTIYPAGYTFPFDRAIFAIKIDDEGTKTNAQSRYICRSGLDIVSIGFGAIATGGKNLGIGTLAHVEGYNSIAANNFAHAEGNTTQALGSCAHAEGKETEARGYASHAEGRDTHAASSYAHAEGYITHANGGYSHTEGHETKTENYCAHAEGRTTTASGDAAHAEGRKTLASGNHSHAEGLGDTAEIEIRPAGQQIFIKPGAIGEASHTEGNCTSATQKGAHAEGQFTLASGPASHAEGSITIAKGEGSHTEGIMTMAESYGSHAEGEGTVASGYIAHAEGYYTTAYGGKSHAEGYQTVAKGEGCHAEGGNTIAGPDENTDPVEWYSHAEGRNTKATGKNSHSEGFDSIAKGNASHAEGHKTVARGDYSHAEGYSEYTEDKSLELKYTIDGAEKKYSVIGEAVKKGAHVEGGSCTAYGERAHAEGRETIAVGNGAHAEGYRTIAVSGSSHAEGDGTVAHGTNAHSEGCKTIAQGQYSHAEGHSTLAKADYSHASGFNTKATASCQTAIGKYNKENSSALFIVGNGTSDTARKNAFEVISNSSGSAIKIGNTTLTEAQLIKLINFIDTIEG